MIPLKWKIYRVLNFTLLVIGVIFFLLFILSMSRGGDMTGAPWQVWVMGLIFLLMVVKSLINILLQFRYFPDKKLVSSSFVWHAVALIMGFITMLGLMFFFVSVAIEEIGRTYEYSQSNEVLIMLFLWFFVCIADCFVFYCQLGLNRFLDKNEKALSNAMINSIGENT